MTEEFFLTELRDALKGSVDSQTINENVRYYEEYIETEVRKGRSMEEVLDSLGNPRLLAKTVIDTSDPQNLRGASYEEWKEEEEKQEKQEEQEEARRERARILTGWKATLALIAIPIVMILFLILVVYLVGSFIIFLGPVFILIVAVWIVFGLWNKN